MEVRIMDLQVVELICPECGSKVMKSEIGSYFVCTNNSKDPFCPWSGEEAKEAKEDQRQRMWKVSGKWFRDESWVKAEPYVFVLGFSEAEAREKAIVKFREQIKEQDQDFDQLSGYEDHERIAVFEKDASLYTLFKAAQGNVTVTKIDSCSDVFYY